MKKITLTLTFLFAGLWMMAQSTIEKQAASAVADVDAFFQLDKAQKNKMTEIYVQKLKDINEIQGLKKSDLQLYANKRMQISERTFTEIKAALNETQSKKYSDWVRQKGQSKSELYKKLKSEGKTDLEIQVQMAEVD